jgi:predicted ATP-grasp superfamily ATP-dependent carboligase
MPADSSRPDLLICALSGRALAQSARRAGFHPAVIDAFADLDTRAAAVAWRRVALTADWRFDASALRSAAMELAPPPVPLLYGSGFERDPALLAELASGRPLFGTSPEALARIVDPMAFAAACHNAGIPHPETQIEPPERPAGWLAKRRGGAGGGHVRPAAAVRPGEARDVYFQKRVDGDAVSLVFVSDGWDVLPLAATRQWTAPGRGFRFSGVSLPETLPDQALGQLIAAARALTRQLAVRGLASLDALCSGTKVKVLELNARPTASLEALELATGASLVGLHVAAVRGRLPQLGPQPMCAASSEIVFVPEDCLVPHDFAWPAHAGDRTPGGTMVPRHGPVATVTATAATAAAARLEVCRRREQLLAMLAQGGAFARAGVVL